jgi:long-chain acyl-CoA synthetase
MGLEAEDIKGIMEQNRNELNTIIPAYSKISEIIIREQEFEKTPKKSIKRYLYQNI